MPVEISILSGARQGQRQALDATRFKAGPDAACEVFFDPAADPPVKNRFVVLHLMEDGWYIQSTGQGDVYVNDRPVVGMTRIRSGSVVRMSESGPDFMFTIASRAAAAPTVPPASTPAPPAPPLEPPGFAASAAPAEEIAPPLGPVPAGPVAPPVMGRSEGMPQGKAPVAAPAVASLARGPSPAPDSPGPASQASAPADLGRVAVWLGGGVMAAILVLALLVGVLIFLVLRYFPPGTGGSRPEPAKAPIERGSPEPQSPAFKQIGNQSVEEGKELRLTGLLDRVGTAPGELVYSLGAGAPPGAKIHAQDGVFTWTPTAEQAPGNYQITLRVAAKDSPELGAETTFAVDVRPRTPSLEERLSGAVLLVELERAGRFYPLATCSALGDSTVLTTALYAGELRALVAESGSASKGWVSNPATGEKWEIEGVRSHAVFPSAHKRLSDLADQVKDSPQKLKELADKLEALRSCDLALVTVKGPLPKTLEVASSDELKKLDRGADVFCFGFLHKGDEILPNERLKPRLIAGKVFRLMPASEIPGKPMRVDVRAEIAEYPYGSPVVTDQGKIVAVLAYSPRLELRDAAPPGTENLHYGPLVDRALIDSDIWAPAEKLTTPAEAKTHR